MVERLKNKNEQGMRRVNYIEQTDDEVSDMDEEQLMLKIDGKGSKPFYKEGLMRGNFFTAIIERAIQNITNLRKAKLENNLASPSV